MLKRLHLKKTGNFPKYGELLMLKRLHLKKTGNFPKYGKPLLSKKLHLPKDIGKFLTKKYGHLLPDIGRLLPPKNGHLLKRLRRLSSKSFLLTATTTALATSAMELLIMVTITTDIPTTDTTPGEDHDTYVVNFLKIVNYF